MKFQNKNFKNNYLFLYICAFFISFAGFLSGYDTGIISGALLFIEKSFKLTSFLSGALVGAVSLGAVSGAFINGLIIDKIGRKKTLMIAALIFICGSFMCFFSRNIFELIISRFIIGSCAGVVSFAGPLYLSEISVKKIRGQIVSFHQLAITLGILVSYFSGYFCSNFENNWRIMFLLGAVPAVVLFFAMIILCDTPRWYISVNKENKAKYILKKIDKNQDIDFEINEIKKTLFNKCEKLNFSKKLIKPFIIGSGIMIAQVATGINAIIYFAPSIFKAAGFSSNKDALFVTIFIGLINFLMTFIAIAFVDKLGRKPLLYIGLSGMLFNLILLTLSLNLDFSFMKYLAIISIALYVVSFSVSLGPVGLLLISEVFPLKFRGFAMSFAIILNFIVNFIVTGLFPIVSEKYGASSAFLFFALVCILSLIFVYKIVPETKGVSLEEIEKNWI